MDSLEKAGRPKIAKESFRKIPRAPAPITTPTRRGPASQSHRLQRQLATLQYTIDRQKRVLNAIVTPRWH